MKNQMEFKLNKDGTTTVKLTRAAVGTLATILPETKSPIGFLLFSGIVDVNMDTDFSKSYQRMNSIFSIEDAIKENGDKILDDIISNIKEEDARQKENPVTQEDLVEALKNAF